MLEHLSSIAARTRKAWASALAVAVATFVVQMLGITQPDTVQAVHQVTGAVLEIGTGIVPAVAGALVAYLTPNRPG